MSFPVQIESIMPDCGRYFNTTICGIIDRIDANFRRVDSLLSKLQDAMETTLRDQDAVMERLAACEAGADVYGEYSATELAEERARLKEEFDALEVQKQQLADQLAGYDQLEPALNTINNNLLVLAGRAKDALPMAEADIEAAAAAADMAPPRASAAPRPRAARAARARPQVEKAVRAKRAPMPPTAEDIRVNCRRLKTAATDFGKCPTGFVPELGKDLFTTCCRKAANKAKAEQAAAAAAARGSRPCGGLKTRPLGHGKCPENSTAVLGSDGWSTCCRKRGRRVL